MPARASLPIEEFLEAVTAQLDKTQDALRMKAVNRPLTFALKDFAIDLNVFIEMNEQGDILFRPSGPNEQGASTVQVGFTTITRPMIEENTVSMEMTQSPTLEEVGLAPAERTRLERLGVRNAAQLRRLEESAGNNTMSRLSGVNVDRLRQALQLGRPRVSDVIPDSEAPTPDVSPSTPPPATEPIPRVPRRIQADDTLPGGLAPEEPPREPPDWSPPPMRARRHDDLIATEPTPAPTVDVDRPVIRVKPGEKMLRLRGNNLIDSGLPRVRLNRQPLKIARATDHEIAVELPDDISISAEGGRLDVDLPDGHTETFAVTFESDLPDHNGATEADDPWLPDGDGL